MQNMQIPAGASRIVVEQTVIRCGCGDPTSHPQQPCPTPAGVERQRPAYWHRNPLRRLLFRLTGRVT